MSLIEHLPLFVARLNANNSQYDPAKPYVAGTLDWHAGVGAFYTVIRVKSTTLPLALAKAALIYTVTPKDAPVARPRNFPRLGQRTPVSLDPMPPRTMTTKLPEMPAAPENG